MNPDVTQVSTSGRRRAVPGPAASASQSIARLVSVAVVVAGVAFLIFGALLATVWAPKAVTVGTLTSPRQPIVTTAVGVLGLEGPRLTVTARSSTTRPVFVGIGRARDVDAYLAQAARQEIVGREGNGKLITKVAGSQATLPDPAGADVWVVSSRAAGSAGLVWPDASGQWRLVVATDGAEPAADQVSLSWSGATHHTAAPALVAIGIVLTVGGLITLVVLGSRARLGGDA